MVEAREAPSILAMWLVVARSRDDIWRAQAALKASPCSLLPHFHLPCPSLPSLHTEQQLVTCKGSSRTSPFRRGPPPSTRSRPSHDA